MTDTMHPSNRRDLSAAAAMIFVGKAFCELSSAELNSPEDEIDDVDGYIAKRSFEMADAMMSGKWHNRHDKGERCSDIVCCHCKKSAGFDVGTKGGTCRGCGRASHFQTVPLA